VDFHACLFAFGRHLNQTQLVVSRAFVKEDAPDGPVMIPPRAPLPPGAVNYVTPRGKQLLLDELQSLESEHETLMLGDKNDPERTRLMTINRGRMNDLRQRISTAKVLVPERQPQDEIRFGAHVRVETIDGSDNDLERFFSIVGVDEANVSEGRIAFIAPFARALMGLKVGDTALVKAAGGEETLRVLEILYKPESSQ